MTRPKSYLEEVFAIELASRNAPLPEREYRFAPPRRYRFDFAWPDFMVAAEIEGGTWSGGRHTRPVGFENDCVKYNLATFAGWRVYRFTGGMVTSGEARDTMLRALGPLRAES